VAFLIFHLTAGEAGFASATGATLVWPDMIHACRFALVEAAGLPAN
jgi:uncharacterized membrane protein YhhN